MHRLSNVDNLSRTADCAHCGPVKVRKQHNGFRCATGAYLSDVKLKYGVEYNKRPEKCDVCSSKVRIVYDHCHSSGAFRGWLCNACNVALGLVRDDPSILRALAKYVEARQ